METRVATSNWRDLAIGLYDKRTGRDAEITDEFSARRDSFSAIGARAGRADARDAPRPESMSTFGLRTPLPVSDDSAHVRPVKLEAAGFQFHQPMLEHARRAGLGR